MPLNLTINLPVGKRRLPGDESLPRGHPSPGAPNSAAAPAVTSTAGPTPAALCSVRAPAEERKAPPPSAPVAAVASVVKKSIVADVAGAAVGGLVAGLAHGGDGGAEATVFFRFRASASAGKIGCEVNIWGGDHTTSRRKTRN